MLIKTGLNNALLLTLSTISFSIVTPDPLLHLAQQYCSILLKTMKNACGQQNIVQSCYTTGSKFVGRDHHAHRQFTRNRFRAYRPDSTTAKYFARNCLWEIRMVGHEWFYWILSLFSPSQWVELNSTHWRSEFFAREERIQWNYSYATIRISHKQFLAKYFAVVESGLNSILKFKTIPTSWNISTKPAPTFSLKKPKTSCDEDFDLFWLLWRR